MKQSRWIRLAWVVMLLFVVSSGFVGFRLGQNTTGQGMLVDTIVLSPQQGQTGTGTVQQTSRYLSGRLLYADGTPCPSATVRLAELDMSEQTSAHGKFFFSGIESGDHTVEVHSQQGDLLCTTAITLQFDETATAQMEESVLTLPENVRVVELTFTLDEEKTTLTMQPDQACAVTEDGSVVNFNGAVMPVEENTTVVLPSGDVLTDEGYALLPSLAVVITPWGTDVTVPALEQTKEPVESDPVESEPVESEPVESEPVESEPVESEPVESEPVESEPVESEPVESEPVESEPVESEPTEDEPEDDVVEIVPGIVVDGNGDLILDNGTVIQPDGTVTTPDGEKLGGGDEIVLVPDEGDAIVGSVPALPTTTPAPTPTQPPQASVDEPEEDEVAVAPTPTPTPEPVSLSWSQESTIDLFANRTGSGYPTETITENGVEKELPVIAPGSSGYYDFSLRNDADYNVSFRLSLSENSFHLPILYTVRDMETNYLYKSDSKINYDGSAITTRDIVVSANSEHNYRIEWEWQMDDWLNPTRDNRYDTAAATGDDRVYTISVRIDATQMFVAHK